MTFKISAVRRPRVFTGCVGRQTNANREVASVGELGKPSAKMNIPTASISSQPCAVWQCLASAVPSPLTRVVLQQSQTQLRVTWSISAAETAKSYSASTKPAAHRIARCRGGGQPVAVVLKALNPMTLLTVGSRDAKNPQGWGAFFDNPPQRPSETFLVALGKRRVQTTNEGNRTTISLAEAAAGGFRGDVRFTFIATARFSHVETVMITGGLAGDHLRHRSRQRRAGLERDGVA